MPECNVGLCLEISKYVRMSLRAMNDGEFVNNEFCCFRAPDITYLWKEELIIKRLSYHIVNYVKRGIRKVKGIK